MKDYKGIVFFDYDETLIDEVDGIFEMPDSTKEALIKLRENGYAVCVCTGRTKQFSEDVKEYFNGYVIGMGSYAEIDGEVIQSIEITESEIEDMRQICAPRNISLLMDGETQSYCDGMEKQSYQFFKYVFGVRDHWVLPWDTKDKCKINKLTFLYDHDEDYDFLKEHFSSQLELAKHIRYHFTDATPIGVDKGSGIRAMTSALGISLQSTFAFGDGDNDLSMMQTVGTGIIMGRHYKGLEPYAAFTTDTAAENGIYNGCKELGLI